MNRIFSLLLYFVYILLIFVILPVVLGADKLDSLKIFIYAIVFFIFPGYTFLRYAGFINANYIEAFIYSLTIGIAYHSFVFTLLFVVGLEKYQYATLLVPFVLAAMAHNRQPVLTAKTVVMDEKFNSSLIIIVFVSVIISLYWFLSAPDIDDHLVMQGIIIQTLKNGFPLLDPYVDGMLISYNFLSHLLLLGMHLQTNVDIDMLIGKIAPIWFMVLAILSVFLFSVKLLRLNVFFTFLAIISVFWVVGYADFNGRLFGRAVATSATRVLSPLFAFTLYFLALTWFSLYTKIKFKLKIAPYFISFLFGFLLTGARGPAAVILICSVGFLFVVKFFKEKRLSRLLFIHFCALFLGFLLGLWFFFNYGTDISNTNFLTITWNPVDWLYNKSGFYIVKILKNHFNNVAVIGILAFFCIVFFQAGFLSLLFWSHIGYFVKSENNSVILLMGGIIAGICAIFFTSAPGGSHFTFYHYSIIGSSMLGAQVFQRLYDEKIVHKFYKLNTFYSYLIIATAFLFMLHIWDVKTGLSTPGGRGLNYKAEDKRVEDKGLSIFFSPPKFRGAENIEFANLVSNGDALLVIANREVFSAYESLYIAMKSGVRYISHPVLINWYITWDLSVKKQIVERHKKINQLKNKAVQHNTIDMKILNEVAGAVIYKGENLYILSNSSVNPDGCGLELISKKEKLSLWRKNHKSCDT